MADSCKVADTEVGTDTGSTENGPGREQRPPEATPMYEHTDSQRADSS